jgi:hypothetical protein
MMAMMIRSEARWNAAVARHDAAVREFLAACESCAPDDWYRAADGKWSTAAVALHICNTYELGRDAMTRGVGMRLVVSERYAWALRTFVLPWIIATTRFPRARAPREVVPGENETKQLTPEAARTRLMRAAREAANAFRGSAASPATPRMTHAYFGSLSPYTALRLLTAHTRHHARALTRKSVGGNSPRR